MSLNGSSNEERIWNYLMSKINNKYGVAGLMGNLHAESGLNPKNLQNSYEKKLGYSDSSYTNAVDNGSYTRFVRDSAGYGLAQWTYWSRKQNLLNYAKSCKASIGDLEMQLNFLMTELNGYGLTAKLKSAKSVKEASNIILLQFEKPANQGESVQNKRVEYGQAYYNKYAGTSTSVPTPSSSVPASKKYLYNGIDYSPVFNADFYAKKYADVVQVFGTNPDSLFKHFTQYGMKEGRQGSADFVLAVYKQYRDLQQAFGDKNPKYYEHYCKYGKTEGRKCK